MGFSLAFILYFFHGLYLIGPLIILLLTVILGLGQIVGRIESWSKLDSFYWSLITAMTVGYGDIRPRKDSTKLLSLIIGFFGLVLTGITVAMTVDAGSKAFVEYASYDETTNNNIDEKIDHLEKRVREFEDRIEG